MTEFDKLKSIAERGAPRVEIDAEALAAAIQALIREYVLDKLERDSPVMFDAGKLSEGIAKGIGPVYCMLYGMAPTPRAKSALIETVGTHMALILSGMITLTEGDDHEH